MYSKYSDRYARENKTECTVKILTSNLEMLNSSQPTSTVILAIKTTRN